MRVLIIDDSQPKRDEIIQVLIDAKVVTKKDFTQCTNIIDAKKMLRDDKFDVLLLDMQLPNRVDSKEIKSMAGLEFLKEFLHDRRYNQPKKIIGITEYEDEINKVKDDFDENLLHIIHYVPSESKWQESLINGFEQLISTEKSTESYNYDIAIICALKTPEYDAVKNLSNDWIQIKKENTALLFEETYFEFENKKLKVIAAYIDKIGMVPTAVLSTQVIELFRPKYLTMTGISAGIEGEVELGDILVIDPSWDSGAGKLKESDEGNVVFEIDPQQERIDADIILNIKKLSDDTDYLNKLREDWKYKKIKNILSVHTGAVASGAAVIANENVAKEIKKLQGRKLIGIEMEAYGLIYAAKHAIKPRPEPLVIKSVCDFANKDKNDGYQEYASYTSANFLYEYANRYIN
jgi:nucleoside phosphorylase